MKILLFFVLAVALFGVMATSVSAEEKVPSWIKNTAGWWATDSISETEFLNAIQFLVNDGIIQVEATSSNSNSEKIPSWIKILPDGGQLIQFQKQNL